MNMTVRSSFIALLLGLLMYPMVDAMADGPGSGASLGIPKIGCRLEKSVDRLNFVGNDYVPNTMNVTVTVYNTGTVNADTIEVSLLADTRFTVEAPVIRIASLSLAPNDSAKVQFRLDVARERATDGYDLIQTIATARNGANAQAVDSVWVEHEKFPVLNVLCTKNFTDLVFDEVKNDYVPNPFPVQVTVNNTNDGASEETVVQYLGTRDVDPTTFPVEQIGIVTPTGSKNIAFNLRAVKRTTDTTVTLIFQVQGVGGYKRKLYTTLCSLDVFIPQSRTAVYDVACNIVPDTVGFINHRYVPDPFEYRVNLSNVGNALGKNVKAQIILPPSIQLGTGENGERSLGDLKADGTGNASFSWMLRPDVRFRRDTLRICVRVYDDFNNQGLCCDSVIVDSVRRAEFIVFCTAPDTIRKDTVNGVYLGNPFDVFFTVKNVGSDYADSVKATIIVQTPDLVVVAPITLTQRLADISPSDRLYPDSTTVFQWNLQALPRAISGPVSIKFKAEALNAEGVESTCSIFIPNLEAPGIGTDCDIAEDTLHYNPDTGGYLPASFKYRVRIYNTGGGKADSVRVTLAVPPGLVLAAGELQEKDAVPYFLGPKDTAVVEWVLIPLERRTVGTMMGLVSVVRSTNVAGSYACTDSVFVPALPNTAALSISRDNVTYTGQTIYVPMSIDQSDGKDIQRFDFILTFNVDSLRNALPKRVVDFIGVELRSSKLSGWVVEKAELLPGTQDQLHVIVHTPNGTPMTGGSPPPLLYLIFKAIFGGEGAGEAFKIARTSILWPSNDQLEGTVLINNGSIFPRVKDGDGLITVSGDCIRPLNATDRFFSVAQNRPNPFNPATSIEYTLAEDCPVRLSVLDLLGREVQVLVSEYQTAGRHVAVFNGASLPSGMYLYRLETPRFARTLKMVLAK